MATAAVGDGPAAASGNEPRQHQGRAAACDTLVATPPDRGASDQLRAPRGACLGLPSNGWMNFCSLSFALA